jgi:CTP synthase
MKVQRTKYIFITGGVCSSLGKGIVAASVGALLESRGLRVSLSKADPYINVDPGTMSPQQHGEVFVTADGAETDLDLGHYERFTRAKFSRFNSFSSGQVYDQVLGKERQGDYLGMTVQVVPHITNQIKDNIVKASQKADISIIEIGGTVGDIESQPYLETIRQMRYEQGGKNVLCIHLTLLPYLAAAGELKTKPTQHSVKELRSIGVQPDVLICRADRLISSEIKEKIATFCSVKKDYVLESPDLDSIYKLPLFLHEQGLDQIIVESLNIWTRSPDLSEWQQIVNCLDNPKDKVNIAVVGKYTGVKDSYKSIEEALVHAGIAKQTQVKISYIDAQKLSKGNVEEKLRDYDAIIVPGGFGSRATSGKITAINYARVKKIPFFGICLGMQLALIEIARNVLMIKTANSIEIDEKTQDPVIHLMEEQEQVSQKGASMRLGSYLCDLVDSSLVRKAYKLDKVNERHRHRYEFNNKYKQVFEDNKIIFSGNNKAKGLVEIFELQEHPWFVGCQFHPELSSKPMEAHPLFVGLLNAAKRFKKKA